jgi:hypothetical protein
MSMKNNMEKLYIQYYKQYRNGKITAQQFREKSDEMYCDAGGGALMRLGENAAWYRYENGQWAFNSFMTKAPNRLRLNILTGFKKRHLALKIISLVVVTALFASFVFPGFLTSSYRQKYRKTPVYTSPQITKELYDAVRVNAPEGALLREDQDFDAYELSEQEIYQLVQENNSGIIPLYGFEFDGRLQGDEMFRKDVTVEVDLEKTDIPKELYEYLEVFRLGGSGTDRVASAVDGSTMKISASMNCPILIGIAFWGGVATLIGLATNEAIHNYFEYGGAFAPYSDYTVFKIPGDKYKGYYIYYHDDLSPIDIKSLKAREQAVMQKYGFFWDKDKNTYGYDSAVGRSNDPAREMKRVSYDPEFIDIQKEKGRLPISEAFKILSERIKNAHDYLVDYRGFTNPGTVNFVVTTDWPSSSTALATESRAALRNSMIKVNPSTVKIANLPPDEKTFMLDNLQVTLTHELFHSIQHRYYSSKKEYLWFSEATAGMLEKDCAEYFMKKNIITQYEPVDTDYYHLLRHGTGTVVSEEISINMGYTLSNALFYQRDHLLPFFGSVNKNNYLQSLMTRFGTDYNCNALYNMPGNTDSIMTGYFKSQYTQILSDPRELKTINVNKAQESFNISHISETPFSVGRFDVSVKIPGMSSDELKDSVLLLAVDEQERYFLKNKNINIMYSPDSSNPKAKRTWSELLDKSGICPVDVKNISSGLITCIVNEKQDDAGGQVNLSALVAPKAQKAVSVKYNNELLGFDIELAPEGNTSSGLRRGRAVEVTVPGTSIEKYIKYVDPGENKAFIPVLEILSQNKVKNSFFQKWVTSLLSRAMNASFKLFISSVKTQIGKMDASGNSQFFNMVEFGENPISIGINESFSYTDDDGFKINAAYELRKQGFPTSFIFDAYPEDDLLKLHVEGNNGLYLDYSAKLTDYFKYFRFLKMNPKAGIDYDTLAKKLHEMDNTDVVFTVRDIYSLNNVTSVENAVNYEDCYGKTNDIILGPKSDEITLLTSGLAFDRKSLPEGTYGGKFLFDIDHNIYDAVTTQRMQYKDVRMKEEIEREIQRYIRNHNPTPEALEREKMQIKADVYNAEAEFDENFINSMGNLNSLLNNIYYYLTIDSQTKAALYLKGVKEPIECSIQPTGQTGVYMMTINYPQKPVTVKLVITPNGEIVTEGALAILTRK